MVVGSPEENGGPPSSAGSTARLESAVGVPAELALDEARESGATAFVGAREEGSEVLAQDAEEYAPFRLAALACLARPSLP